MDITLSFYHILYAFHLFYKFVPCGLEAQAMLSSWIKMPNSEDHSVFALI